MISYHKVRHGIWAQPVPDGTNNPLVCTADLRTEHGNAAQNIVGRGDGGVGGGGGMYVHEVRESHQLCAFPDGGWGRDSSFAHS